MRCCTIVNEFRRVHSLFSFFCCRLTECQEEKPLEFEDIVDKKTYDKMRPPKPGGMFFNYVNLYDSKHHLTCCT